MCASVNYNFINERPIHLRLRSLSLFTNIEADKIALITGIIQMGRKVRNALTNNIIDSEEL